MSIEAMKQALEALERLWDDGFGGVPESMHKDAITALRQAIEQAEKQEPSLWFAIGKDGRVKYTTDNDRALKWKQAGSYRLVRDYYTSPVHASDISAERVDETAKCGRDWVEMQCPCGHKMYVKHTGREWVGLTDEEVGGLTVFDGLTHIEVMVLAAFVRVIEAKLKEKNCPSAD